MSTGSTIQATPVTPAKDIIKTESMNMKMKFKKNNSFEKRKAESLRIRTKYSDRIPVIVENVPDKKETEMTPLDRSKYLVPSDLTVGQFIYVIRKRIKLQPEKQIFLFVNGKILPPTSMGMMQLYQEHKDVDGFLYTIISLEATFGASITEGEKC